jgi:transposase
MQQLERQLGQTDDVRVYRRTFALLMWGRGSAIAEIASLLNVRRQSVYNWIATYLQSGDPACLRDRDRSGRPARWSAAIETRLAALLGLAPDQLGYLAVNWTVPLLQDQLERDTHVQFSDDTIRRALHRLGYVWKRYRYVLAPDPDLEKKPPDSWSTAGFSAPQCGLGGR